MKAFVARFVRPSGATGIIHVMATSSVCAMFEVMDRVGTVQTISVRPSRRAVLLVDGGTRETPAPALLAPVSALSGKGASPC